jgi:hypothetical protein
MQDIDAQQLVLSGETIELDFGDGGTIGVVVKGLTFAGGFVVVDAGCSIVARRGERHALQVGAFGDRSERLRSFGRTRGEDSTVFEQDVRRVCVEASSTAAPLRSLPLEAAVAEVLGTLSVRVGMIRTFSRGTPSASAAICNILVCRPCPISVPPWFTCTLPSR